VVLHCGFPIHAKCLRGGIWSNFGNSCNQLLAQLRVNRRSSKGAHGKASRYRAAGAERLRTDAATSAKIHVNEVVNQLTQSGSGK
jgi:hypothetical protein